MSKEHTDKIDDILSDALNDLDFEMDAEASENITFGQSVSSDRQENIVNNHIDEMAKRLDVPESAVSLAKSLRTQYRTQRGDLIGTALELIAASCLYCAVKVTEVPLDPTDFENAGGKIVTRKALLRRSKDIATTVGLDASAFYSSEQYVDRYCDELDVSVDVRDRAKEIVEKTEDIGLSSGKSPSGWAASAVYNACLDVGEKRSQKEISDIANITQVTIRTRYQEQRAVLREVESLPSDPIEVIRYLVDVTDASEPTPELAERLLENAKEAGYPVENESVLWALAALRRASQLTDGELKIKTLSQYTDANSKEIHTRTKDLRDVITALELQNIRN